MGLTPLEAPAAPFAVTTDELRAMARIAGAPLSSLLLDGEDEADAPVADAVALRGLAARRLVSIIGEPTEPDAVRLTPVALRLLDPVLAPDAIVEIEADRCGSPSVQRHVVCANGAGIVVLSEADEADVWRVLDGAGDVASTVGALVDLSRPAAGGSPDPARRLRVPAAVHDAADEALEEGADAVAVLVAGGADPAAAAAWVAAVTGRASSVEVRAARLLPGDVVEAAALRVVCAGDLGTWIVDLDDDRDDDLDDDRDTVLDGALCRPGADDPWTGCTSVMTDVGAVAAAAALAALLPEAAPAAAR